MTTFFVGIGSWDHEGDDFAGAELCLSLGEAQAAIDARYHSYDTYTVYRCMIGTKPLLVTSRSRDKPWVKS